MRVERRGTHSFAAMTAHRGVLWAMDAGSVIGGRRSGAGGPCRPPVTARIFLVTDVLIGGKGVNRMITIFVVDIAPDSGTVTAMSATSSWTPYMFLVLTAGAGP